MPKLLNSAINAWIGRRARPSLASIAAVGSLKPAVVVTGGSRGIGVALAREFARSGKPVALVARDLSGLEAAAGAIQHDYAVTVLAIDLDIRDPGAAANIETRLKQAGFYADIIVNNAGIGLSGSFEDATGSEVESLVALNISALTRLMHHALPAMRGRGRGGVLNIASLGGYGAGPYQALYYASKAYVISLTEAVGGEMAGSGVRISVVAPGPVATGFHAAMGAENARYRSLIPSHSPEFVARSAVRGFNLGRRVIVPGLFNTAAAYALRVIPRFITVPVFAWLLDPRRPKG